MTVKLKLFIQGGFCMPNCCGAPTLRATDGEALFAKPWEYESKVNELLKELRSRYGERLDVSVVNSWGFFELWDVLRLKISPSKPTWVLEGKKVFEGVPKADEIMAAVDAAIGGQNQSAAAVI
ncbi:MAG: hypothetical protein LBU46_05365 [Candidatus Accumulibacter sp.]|jgi:hypothetical protein|nr:hypothetical protein [Accumulibacter sp.]